MASHFVPARRSRIMPVSIALALVLAVNVLTMLPGVGSGGHGIAVKAAGADTLTQPPFESSTYPPTGYSYLGSSAGQRVEMSDDGRFVTLTSGSAAELYDRDGNGNGVLDDSNPPAGIDLGAGLGLSFSAGADISGDGNTVAFVGKTSTVENVYVRSFNRTTRTLGPAEVIATQAIYGGDNGPSLSGDGRYVAFSTIDALVPEDTNGIADVYVKDRTAGTFERESVSSSGAQGVAADDSPNSPNVSAYVPVISEDGTQVAFLSYASNLVSGDTNNDSDLFVRNRTTGTTTRESVATDGSQSSGSGDVFQSIRLSANGRFIAFWSGATGLANINGTQTNAIYLRDRDSDGNGVFDESGGATTTWISSDSNYGQHPGMSEDGRYISYEAQPGAAVHVYDRTLNKTIQLVGAGVEQFS